MKKLRLFLSALVLSVSSLAVMVTPHAFAATKTWTGTAGDHKFSTGANWGGTAPSNGDTLVFDNTSVTDFAPDNDMSSASFALITFSGSGTSGFTISGNAFTMTGGITNSTIYADTISANVTVSGGQTINTGAGYVYLTGTVGGSGSITKTGTGQLHLDGNNSGYTGTITASAGRLMAGATNSFGTASAPGAIINDGADVTLQNCTAFDFAGNLTLNGASSLTTGDSPRAKLASSGGSGCSGGGGDEIYGTAANNSTVNLTGTITLSTDATFASLPKTTTLSGPLSGAHAINLLPGYGGQLVVAASSNNSSTANGTYSAPQFTKTLSDDLPTTTVLIQGNSTITIDGVRGDTTLAIGATLKGTGTVGVLSSVAGSTVAPGHSPGCMTANGGLFLAGGFDVEIGGTTPCTGYDQLKVIGGVTLTGSTLNTSLYNNFKPVKGQKYVIIDNDGADAVTGTFTGLAEGATYTQNGYVYQVTYKGGDGNDVVLTVQTVPAAPDTGLTLLKDNPLLTAGLMVIAAGGILLASRRKFAHARTRR